MAYRNGRLPNMDFALFKGAISSAYVVAGRHPSSITVHLWKKLHILSCPFGGFQTIRHNTGERLHVHHSTANTEDGARINIKA